MPLVNPPEDTPPGKTSFLPLPLICFLPFPKLPLSFFSFAFGFGVVFSPPLFLFGVLALANGEFGNDDFCLSSSSVAAASLLSLTRSSSSSSFPSLPPDFLEARGKE
mmetsp:Transcript_36063/g.60051  ORF Transcript_36063/g.60051 Transcript_36063/m.60051 type:complete len:107 (-) Transcript_36063:558-878(-)